MLKAPIKTNEKERLQALHEYAILDTPPSLNLDEITMIASYICNTPISLISLIDKDRQWFKSKVGLDASQTPRDVSFCGHAIYENEVFIIEDPRKDKRFKDNPLVTEQPNVTFYAGAQLVTPSGYKIGTLCVIDTKPNKLDKKQIEILKALSNQVVSIFELQKQNKKIIENQKTFVNNAKMLSLGEMSSGIAHEINNPLMIILGRINLLEEALNPKIELNKKNILDELKKIANAAERIAKIIKSLRQFTKNSDNESFEEVPIIKIITDNLLLCEEKFKKSKIKITVTPQDNIDDILIYCKPSLFSQVILNILMNAYDALEHVDYKEIEINIKNEINYTKISILDTGVGIPELFQDKIMQPFYTTKEVGKGTGLGLSIAKGIIDEHNGKFYLDNTQKNTCFIIELPHKPLI